MAADSGDIEKASAGLTVSEDPSSIHHSHEHDHRHFARRKLRNFVHPNGKRIHIAADPADAENLRQRLKELPDEDFDICISGTSEHINALRHAHTHHEERRQQLERSHSEVYKQFASVQGDLDSLSGELHRITEHGVSMDAHFDRWGYSAHIKSYDEEDGPSRSGTTTPRKGSSAKSVHGVSDTEEPSNSIKIFKHPVLRQYFHKGILWRASSTEQVMSFELFVDLLYVGIIAINGDAASEDPTGLSLLRFVITFTLSWKIWNDMALIISWFETDDLFQRFSILFLPACLFGYTTNITEAFNETYPTLIGFYLAARMYMVIYLFAISFLIPMIRFNMLLIVASALIGVALWIGSIHVEWPNQLALIFIALTFDLVGHMFTMFQIMLANKIGGKYKAWSEKAFEFMPALNIEHRTERTNAFVTLVFGYTVVAILYQSSVNGVDAFFGKGVLGLIQAFCFNWIYFEIDSVKLQSHAIRRHKISATIWGFAHLPFIMSYVLGSGALARLVIMSDTPGAHIDTLTAVYQARSEHEIPAGIRWFYCAGFGIALLFMALISLTHVHKETIGQRLKKTPRLIIRVGVAIILICLPLAETLDSLSLVGTVTGLIIFLLITELWACSCKGTKLWARDKPCKYLGKCEKKDLQSYVLSGKELNLGDLGNEGKYKDSGLDTAPM